MVVIGLEGLLEIDGCNWLLGRVSFATRQELVEELLFIYDFYAPLPHGEKSL